MSGHRLQHAVAVVIMCFTRLDYGLSSYDAVTVYFIGFTRGISYGPVSSKKLHGFIPKIFDRNKVDKNIFAGNNVGFVFHEGWFNNNLYIMGNFGVNCSFIHKNSYEGGIQSVSFFLSI